MAAGPPYPAPVTGQRVYDTAGILSSSTIAEAERISRAIEDRTGAQVVVYTQLKPESDTPGAAERDAIALMDQWGIGRKGFDDGLVILFDMDASLRHGQVQLYAGPGYRDPFLSNEERQAIYENDMLPLLRGGDLDGALLAAMAKIDQRDARSCRSRWSAARISQRRRGPGRRARPVHPARRLGRVRGCATAGTRSSSTIRRC